MKKHFPLLALLLAILLTAPAAVQAKSITVNSLLTLEIPDTWTEMPVKEDNVEHMAMDMTSILSDAVSFPPTFTVIQTEMEEGLDREFGSADETLFTALYQSELEKSFPGFRVTQSQTMELAGKSAVYIAGTAPFEDGEIVMENCIFTHRNSLVFIAFMYDPGDSAQKTLFQPILQTVKILP